MKFSEIFQAIKPFASVAASFIPGGPAVVGVLNAILPAEKQLPQNATGQQIIEAHEGLKPEQQIAIAEKEIDLAVVEVKESGSTLREALQADVKNPHSTRPYIAKGAFQVVAFCTVVQVTLWAYGVAMGKPAVISTVVNGWQFNIAVTGPLVALLYAYFGILKTEHKNRLHAAGGTQAPGILGVITGLLSRSNKKG